MNSSLVVTIFQCRLPTTRGGGGNSYTGHGIHVPARVMGQFAVFCPGYGSCFLSFALVMGLLYGDLPQLWINVSNL